MAANLGGVFAMVGISSPGDSPEVSEGTWFGTVRGIFSGDTTRRREGEFWRLHGLQAIGKNMRRNVKLDHFRKKTHFFQALSLQKPIKTGNFEDQYTLRHTGSKPSIGGSQVILRGIKNNKHLFLVIIT